MRSHMFQKVFRVVIIMAFTSVTVAQAAPIELTKATYQDHLRPTAAIKTPLADDIKSSLKGFPGVTVHEETFTPNVEELLSSRLSRYEGIAISRNSQVVVKPNASAVVNNLAILLNLSFSKIKPFISYNIPDGGIQIHIVEHLPANALKLMDLSGRVHLLFDKSFIETFLFNQDKYPEVVVWLLTERLAHELSHNNTIGTQQQERQEEIDVIINTDLQLYRRLLANKPLKEEVDRFFANVRPSFGSGHYFGGLLEEIVDKSPAEIREAVETYVDIYSDFDAMQFPAGFHPIGNAEIELLIRKLLDLSTKEKAVSELVNIGKPAVPLLIEALRNKDQHICESASWALGRMGPVAKEAVPSLIKTLKDENLDVRRSVTYALGEIGPAAKDAVPALIKALGDEDEHVRCQTAETLGEIGPVTDEVIPALIKALGDKEEWVRKSVASALGKIGPPAKEAVPALIKALGDEDSYVRCNAAESLGKIGPVTNEVILALIKALLGDENKSVRAFAALALGEIGPVTEEVIPTLEKALGDENEHVRESAAEALERIGPVTEEVIPALIKALRNENEDVRMSAGRALSEIGPAAKDAIPSLIEALGDQDYNVRAFAALALNRIGPVAIPALRKALEDEDIWVRESAAEALRKIKTDSAPPTTGTKSFPAGFHPIRNAKIKSLIRKLRNKNPDVREYAALLALGKIGPAAKEAVPALIKALADEDSDVRSEAAKTLGEIGPVTEEVIHALIKALEDEYFWVRKSAAYALVKIGPAAKAAVPALIKALEDENWLVREYAAYTLVEIGPAAKAAVPALIKALGDEEPWVRRTVVYALGKIGPAVEAAVPAIIKALGDKNFDVRERAAEALGKIGPVTEEVIPALIKALGDESKWVRRYAIEAVVEIGPVTIPALQKALGDKKWNVRKSAAAALREIDTDSVPPTTGTKSFPAGNEKFITRLSDIQNILLDAPLLPDQENLLSESLQGLNKIDADLIGVKQQDRILRPLVSDIQSRIALQRSIIGLAGFCRGVVRVDSDGMIIFDPEIIQDEKQRQAVISILSDSTMLSALEDALSAKDEKGKIAARTRVVLLTDVLTNRVALGKNSILISNEQKIDNVKLLNVAGVKSEQGFFPVPQLIALARGLLSINKENFSKLYPAVNRLYIRLTQSTIPDELKAVLENCSWSEFELIIYILPSAEALDQKETEKLHRQALAAMIAA